MPVTWRDARASQFAETSSVAEGEAAEDDFGALLDTTPDDSEVADVVVRAGGDVAPPLFGMGEQPEFDIPVTEHPYVDRWIRYFQGPGQERFLKWLSRSTRAAPVYYPILAEQKLPKDLLFLSMIESGFSSAATSFAHAAGPWQFIPETGRRMGLVVDFWVDERRDLERSTWAAGRYLSYLHRMFGDWHLAWAGYNAGEARVARAIRRAGTRDFWRLVHTRHLPRETKQYVPKLIAAALVSKRPEAFGLEPPSFLDPITIDVVTVTVATDLATIARACGGDVTEDELAALNPALYRKITPPGRTYELHVPKFWGDDCESGLRSIPVSDRLTYRFHAIERNETASKLAQRYGTSVESLLTKNRISPEQLAGFEAIAIPIPLALNDEVPIREPPTRWRHSPPYTPDSPPMRIHRVRRGESLWRIARIYGVSLQKLRAWNGLWGRRTLRVGQPLVIRRISG